MNIHTRYAAILVVLLLMTLPYKAMAKVRVWTIGDSTVQPYGASEYPRTGWGQVLGLFFDDTQVEVLNKAIGGTTTKSFYENHWNSPVKNNLAQGDYLFIQFGINDMYNLQSTELFKQYLTLFVNEARAKGAYPVLVSTLCGNNSTWGDYPAATAQAAATLGVPFVDLSKASQLLLSSVGKEYATHFIYMNLKVGDYANYPNGSIDNTHIQEIGAIDMARLVVEGLKQLPDDVAIKNLCACLVPTYLVTFTANNNAGGIISRTADFPAGSRVTAKAVAKPGYKLEQWSGYMTNSLPITTFIMPDNDITVTATFVEGDENIAVEKITNGDFSQWKTRPEPTSKTKELLYPVGWLFEATPTGGDAGGLTKWGDVIFERTFGADFVQISGRGTPYKQQLYQVTTLGEGMAQLSVNFKGGAFTEGNPSIRLFLQREGDETPLYTYLVSTLPNYNATDFIPHTVQLQITQSGTYRVGVEVENVNSQCWVQMTNFSLMQQAASAIKSTNKDIPFTVQLTPTEIQLIATDTLLDVTLYTMNGILSKQIETSNDQVMLARPSLPGLYILSVTTPVGTYTRKLML